MPLAFAIGKNDEVTFTMAPETGEVDVFVNHEDQERLIIRFLEKEAVALLKGKLEHIQFRFDMPF